MQNTTPTALRGHTILIVENDISPFVDTLQRAIDATGADSIVIRQPAAEVIDRMRHWNFSAAVVNIEHALAVGYLGIPAVIYGTPELPPRPRAIVEALTTLLMMG